ncbi:hypothetical protein BZ382_21475 [Salmonella enterica subsp. enterica serovar Enteritidis]|nr:hypothetical protein [Salmonella enterica subsp. enterica serovar Enteritidis]EDI2556407.1 hypothetical protein [Salmonella enterica subsp. enterica serovar Ajiobo]EEK3526128.1 hypothetical protein [Salmonella enterica subsp. enterica]
MSGLKGRRISADKFAIMLKISAGQLVFAARHDKPLRGLVLPPYRIEGGKSWSSTTSTRRMTFYMQEAVDFSEKYHKIQSPDG